MDEETADVVFEIGGEQQTKGKRKRAKKCTTNFHTHRPILQKCAPTLYEMCKSMMEELLQFQSQILLLRYSSI